jgi:hypothetical protein
MIRGWVQGGATVRRSNASLLNGTICVGDDVEVCGVCTDGRGSTCLDRMVPLVLELGWVVRTVPFVLVTPVLSPATRVGGW